jgi:hypothetical protein
MAQIAAIVALLQAGLLLFAVLLGGMPSPTPPIGQPAIDLNNNIGAIAGTIAEAIVIVGLAVALLNRHVWGAFALVADSVMETFAKSFQFGAGATVGSLIFVAIYGAGAWALLHSEHKRPLHELKWREIVRYGLLLYAGLVTVGFIFGFIGFRKEMSTMPSFWVLTLVWSLSVLALAAKFDSRWPFETVVGVSTVAALFGLIDVPVNVSYYGVSFGNAFLLWLVGGMYLIAAGIVAWGVASVLPLPIVQPGEVAKSILAIRLREYDHTQVMRDTRRLLLIIGTMYMGLAYYLFTGGGLQGFVKDDWVGCAIAGMVYGAAALLKSFWFRFICIVFWTCDVVYSSIILGPQVSPSMFIPIGAYFTYQMWSHRTQILAGPTGSDQSCLQQPVTTGITNQSESYGFGLASTPDPSSDSGDRSKPVDG